MAPAQPPYAKNPCLRSYVQAPEPEDEELDEDEEEPSEEEPEEPEELEEEAKSSAKSSFCSGDRRAGAVLCNADFINGTHIGTLGTEDLKRHRSGNQGY